MHNTNCLLIIAMSSPTFSRKGVLQAIEPLRLDPIALDSIEDFDIIDTYKSHRKEKR